MSKQTDLINIPDAITVSGSNVGIGTSSPSADLDIKRTAGDNNDILRVGSTDNYYHGFARSNTTGALSIQGNQTNFNNILLAPTSGNVGIGTSTPRTESGATTLEVSDSTTARAIIKSTGTGGREYGWYSSTAGQFGLYDYTANTERMRIDSSGRVTTPSQPAFMARLDTSFTVGPNPTTLPAGTAVYNIGGHYSTGTYRFTAPVAGRYLFALSIQYGNTGGSHVSLYVNNSASFAGQGWIDFGDADGATQTMIHNLAAGDYVEAKIYHSTANTNVSTGRTKWMGYLIG
jgi:hypothetical protein